MLKTLQFFWGVERYSYRPFYPTPQCFFWNYRETGCARHSWFDLLMQLHDDNGWYNFDDTRVSSINEEDVKTAAAYVLFYRRVCTVHSNNEGAAKGS